MLAPTSSRAAANGVQRTNDAGSRMTVLAGVISLDPALHVPAATREALHRNVSRTADDARIILEDPRAYFVKVDIGAFGRPAHRASPAGSMAMLAGEPLLTGTGPAGMERDVQLQFLHSQLDAGNLHCLRAASGTFCCAYFNPRTATAHLIADRLALRPLYYAAFGDYLYFSSALRILEALPEVPKTMDVTSVAEITGFGYPFGARTAYAGISVLQPCEVVTLRGREVSSSHYFRWDSIGEFQGSEEEALDETRRRFQAAVRRRLRGDRTVLSYLSGGLDSRCTVAALRAEGVRAYTFNFSLPGTQDQVFGRDFAARIGTVHHDVPTEPNPDWSAIMADAWRAAAPRYQLKPERSHLVWSGEGGSVGVGHVYFSPEIVALLKDERNTDGAIEVFLRQQHKSIKTRILQPPIAAQFRDHLHARLAAELASIRHPDPLRMLSIFLNSNGPRRHLVEHFDDNDRHRLEFLMPFNDAEFVEWMTSLPAESCLYHRFYVRWLSRFDPAVVAVPWQAYPGHVPSPVPIPADLPDQWTASAPAAHQAAERRELLRRSAAMLTAADFPRPLLRRSYLTLMYWACKLGLLDYAYALKTALTYYGYWHSTGGRHVLTADARRLRARNPTAEGPGVVGHHDRAA
jgi:asparagine synthase (glutamine-hydrolysing)